MLESTDSPDSSFWRMRMESSFVEEQLAQTIPQYCRYGEISDG